MRKPLMIPRRERFWGDAIGGPKVDVRRLLSRIPDDVVLSSVTRALELSDPSECLCGWVVREEIIRTTGEDDAYLSDAPELAADLFGGTKSEWLAVYMGVTRATSLPVIELAWVERVDRAVRRA